MNATDPPRRVDAVLVERGLARSREQARDLVRDGAVRLAGTPVAKPSTPVPSDADLSVEHRPGDHHVSRGADKLTGALDALPAVDPGGRRCLDAGASTGGFTQVLIERGAREVLAVDVGHGQLVPALAADPRVRAYEGLHVNDLDVAPLGGPVDLTVADLSFVSLRHVLAALVAATDPDGDLLPMVKPQFEVGRARLGSGGVVRDDRARREAVAAVAAYAEELGWGCRAVVRSPAPGPAGNVEYFLHLRRGPATADVTRDWPAP